MDKNNKLLSYFEKENVIHASPDALMSFYRYEGKYDPWMINEPKYEHEEELILSAEDKFNITSIWKAVYVMQLDDVHIEPEDRFVIIDSNRSKTYPYELDHTLQRLDKNDNLLSMFEKDNIITFGDHELDSYFKYDGKYETWIKDEHEEELILSAPDKFEAGQVWKAKNDMLQGINKGDRFLLFHPGKPTVDNKIRNHLLQKIGKKGKVLSMTTRGNLKGMSYDRLEKFFEYDGMYEHWEYPEHEEELVFGADKKFPKRFNSKWSRTEADQKIIQVMRETGMELGFEEVFTKEWDKLFYVDKVKNGLVITDHDTVNKSSGTGYRLPSFLPIAIEGKAQQLIYDDKNYIEMYNREVDLQPNYYNFANGEAVKFYIYPRKLFKLKTKAGRHKYFIEAIASSYRKLYHYWLWLYKEVMKKKEPVEPEYVHEEELILSADNDQLSDQILPEVARLIKAKKSKSKSKIDLAHAKFYKKIRNLGYNIKKVIPRTFTKDEMEEPGLLAKRISCIIQVKEKDNKYNPFGVCRASVREG